MVRLFKTKPFARFARKERITDAMLCKAMAKAMKKPDADLGGGVLKQRIARPHEGESGGYRSIILFRKGDRAFFVYGFAKNVRDNIDIDELTAFRRLADEILTLPDLMIRDLLARDVLMEVRCDGRTEL